MLEKNGRRYSKGEVIELIEQRGGGHRSLGRDYKQIIFRALSRLPRDVVDWAVEKLVFASSLDIYRAYTLNLEELAERGKVGLVILCDNVKGAPEEEQVLDVAHEIAHSWLRHATTFTDIRALKKIESMDEMEADDLALKWLGH